MTRIRENFAPKKKNRLRVGSETREQVEGKCYAFDDSFEHEAWHDGSSTRIVRELCVCQRLRDSCERAFVTHVRESVECYAFDDSVCVRERVRDSCARAFVTHVRESVEY